MMLTCCLDAVLSTDSDYAAAIMTIAVPSAPLTLCMLTADMLVMSTL